jgi:hypothetical protein
MIPSLTLPPTGIQIINARSQVIPLPSGPIVVPCRSGSSVPVDHFSLLKHRTAPQLHHHIPTPRFPPASQRHSLHLYCSFGRRACSLCVTRGDAVSSPKRLHIQVPEHFPVPVVAMPPPSFSSLHSHCVATLIRCCSQRQPRSEARVLCLQNTLHRATSNTTGLSHSQPV